MRMHSEGSGQAEACDISIRWLERLGTMYQAMLDDEFTASSLDVRIEWPMVVGVGLWPMTTR